MKGVEPADEPGVGKQNNVPPKGVLRKKWGSKCGLLFENFLMNVHLSKRDRRAEASGQMG